MKLPGRSHHGGGAASSDLGPRSLFVTVLALAFGFAELVLRSEGSALTAGALTTALSGASLLLSRLADPVRRAGDRTS